MLLGKSCRRSVPQDKDRHVPPRISLSPLKGFVVKVMLLYGCVLHLAFLISCACASVKNVCLQIKTPTARGEKRFIDGRCFYVGRLTLVLCNVKSIGQSFSALCASSLEYVSAISSFHSFSEAVLLFSLTLFRLIGSEHRMHLLCTKSEAFAFQQLNTLLHNDSVHYTRFISICQAFFKKNFISSKKSISAVLRITNIGHTPKKRTEWHSRGEAPHWVRAAWLRLRIFRQIRG